jgi:hypothetical protein
MTETHKINIRVSTKQFRENKAEIFPPKLPQHLDFPEPMIREFYKVLVIELLFTNRTGSSCALH